MSVKRTLFCASALCGSLAFVQPAQAACTTTNNTIACTDTTSSTVTVPTGTDEFTNDGAIQVVNGLAVNAGTDIGGFTNNGSITSTSGQIFSVKIGGMREDAKFTNNGTISTGSNGASAVSIAGPATVENNGSIVTLPGTGNSTGLQVTGASTITNAAGAEIRGGAAGVLTLGVTNLLNAGTIAGANGARLANGSKVDNSGTITGTSNPVYIEADGTVINRAGGNLVGTGIASAIVMQSGSNSVENAGSITTTGTSFGTYPNVIILRAGDGGLSTLNNLSTGVIGHEGIEGGANAVLSTSGTNGEVRIANAGTIHGNLQLTSDAKRVVANGYDLKGNAASGPSLIEGTIYLGGGDDTVSNAGTINGSIYLGGGANTLINAAGGTINGNIYGNTAFDEDGTNNVVLAGTLNGDGNFGGITTLELSGTLNGTITLGGNDDTVILNGRPTITGENKIDTGGGGGDTVIFRGNTGSFEAWRVSAEKMIKDGGGVTILDSGATYHGGITVADGALIFGDDRAEDEIVGDVLIQAKGIYALGGTHMGAVNIERGGVLIGTGRIGADLFTYDVVNDGSIAPGPDDLTSVGTLSINGNYTQTSGGRLDINLGAPGESDRLEVAGTANLAGAVNFVPLDLANTGAYTFLTYGSHTGQFDTINGGGANGIFFSYSVDYQADKAIVNVVKNGSPPPPPPEAGCDPSEPQAGAVVICKAPMDSSYLFTASDLKITAQEGILEWQSREPVITTTGDKTTLHIKADSGIMNYDSVGQALEMRGAENVLLNEGVIDAPNWGTEGQFGPLITIRAGEGRTSTLTNRGVIGHAGADILAVSAHVPLPALAPDTGNVVVENVGSIYGTLDLSSAATAGVYNGVTAAGFISEDTPNLITGSVWTTEGSDIVRNFGTIGGDVTTLDGNDSIENRPGSLIGSSVDMGSGDDVFIQEGDETRLGGDLVMGTGNDTVEFGGKIDGDIFLGDGNDVIGIYGAASLRDARTIDGGSDSDLVSFNGNTGAWDASRFTGIEAIEKDSGGTTVLTGSWQLGPDASLAVVKSGVLEIAQGAELSTGADVEARGTLLVNGTVHGSVANYEDGGIIGGSGSIGTAAAFEAGNGANLLNHGIVAPGGITAGSEFGTLTVYGDFTQTATGELRIELGAPGIGDMLDVKGTASLDGAVQFVPLDASALGNYTFLKAEGGLSGQFATVNPDEQLAQQGIFFTYAVDYSTPNQVSVNVTKTGTSPDPDPNPDPDPDPDPNPDPDPDPDPNPDPDPVVLNLNGNQQAVYDAFMSDGVFSSDLATVRAQLNWIDPSLAGAALGTFSGEIYADTPAVAARAGGEFARLVSNRMVDSRSSRAGGTQRGHGLRLWTQGIGSFGDIDGSAETVGYDHDVSGIAFGADASVSGHARVGIAGGWSDSEVDQSRLHARADVDSYHAGAYAMVGFGIGFLDAQASYAHHDVDVSRKLVISESSSRRAVGETEADEVRASVTLGANLGSAKFNVRPNAGLSYARVKQDALTEEDAKDAGLHVGNSRYEALTGRIGVELQGNLAFGKAMIRPFADLSLAHDLDQDGWTVTNRLIGGGSAFRIEGAEPGRTAGLANIGIAGDAGSVEFRIGYGLEARKRLQAHSLTGGLTFRF